MKKLEETLEPPPVLCKETAALFAALVPKDGAETSEATDACYNATLAVHVIIQAIKVRTVELQGLRRAMLVAETKRAGWTWSSRIDTSCNAMDADCKVVAEALDRLAECSYELDRYGRDWAAAVVRKGITFQADGTGE